MSRTRNMGIVVPEDIRLSEHFLLSDFMGCDSVYRKGYRNLFIDPDGTKLAEGRYLCEVLLEPMLWEYGPLSITYGYISSDLSQKIVSYQDPKQPSYHRWDKGAAADVVAHSWVVENPPILLAHDIDQKFPYSRMITYSESEGICVATQLSERTPRRAFYENRYMGAPGAKPKYIRKSTSQDAKLREAENLVLEHNWRGAGYPTYHGGGRRQLHHRRCGEFSLLTDFLYSDRVSAGGRNMPTPALEESGVFERAGAFYAALLRALDTPRISVIRGFESGGKDAHNWVEGFALEFKPPAYISTDDVADAAVATGLVKAFARGRDAGSITVLEGVCL
jgi:hypothetical protein